MADSQDDDSQDNDSRATTARTTRPPTGTPEPARRAVASASPRSRPRGEGEHDELGQQRSSPGAWCLTADA